MNRSLILSLTLLGVCAVSAGTAAGQAPEAPAAKPGRPPVTLVIVKAVDSKTDTLHCLTLVPLVSMRTEKVAAWSYYNRGSKGLKKPPVKTWRLRTYWVPANRWEEQTLPLADVEFQEFGGKQVGRAEALARLRPGQAVLWQARSVPQGAEMTAPVEGMLVLVPRASAAAPRDSSPPAAPAPK